MGGAGLSAAGGGGLRRGIGGTGGGGGDGRGLLSETRLQAGLQIRVMLIRIRPPRRKILRQEILDEDPNPTIRFLEFFRSRDVLFFRYGSGSALFFKKGNPF